jgi:hypothetical protein
MERSEGMNRCYGKSGWCSACNQWEIIVIFILFLSLSTYGIFKLTQDPYRTIMGPLCDLPKPLPEPMEYHYTRYDSIPMQYYYRTVWGQSDSVFVDTSNYWDSTTGGWR